MARVLGVEKERVVWKAVEQRGLLHYLEDGALDRSSSGLGHGIEIQGYNGDTIGELLDILAGRVELVVMVKVGKGTERG